MTEQLSKWLTVSLVSPTQVCHISDRHYKQVPACFTHSCMDELLESILSCQTSTPHYAINIFSWQIPFCLRLWLKRVDFYLVASHNEHLCQFFGTMKRCLLMRWALHKIKASAVSNHTFWSDEILHTEPRRTSSTLWIIPQRICPVIKETEPSLANQPNKGVGFVVFGPGSVSPRIPHLM